jgi:hypothetical protein
MDTSLQVISGGEDVFASDEKETISKILWLLYQKIAHDFPIKTNPVFTPSSLT